jgi:hypothetical protein
MGAVMFGRIIRTESPDYGGLLVWHAGDPARPVYIAPHLIGTLMSNGSLTSEGGEWVESVVLRQLEAG